MRSSTRGLFEGKLPLPHHHTAQGHIALNQHIIVMRATEIPRPAIISTRSPKMSLLQQTHMGTQVETGLSRRPPLYKATGLGEI
jgi:hypothetical protein